MTSFSPEQTDAILAIVTPLIDRAVYQAVQEAGRSTPVPVHRLGTCRAVDPARRTCQVLVDGSSGLNPISATVVGQTPILGGRVLVLFEPPSGVFAWSMVPAIPAGMVIAYAGTITADTSNADPASISLPPPGYLRCYGQVVNIVDYAALYRAIGTTFNTGGETAGVQFRLPDLRGRMIAGLDNMGGTDAGRLSSSNTLGTTFGAETHTLATGNLPSHTHSTPSHSHAAGSLSVSSHTHSFSATTSSDGSHSHTITGHVLTNADTFTPGGSSTTPTAWSTATADTQGSHTHSVSGTSGSASPSVTGSTATDGSGTSGSTGSGTAVNHMPPGITMHYCISY